MVAQDILIGALADSALTVGLYQVRGQGRDSAADDRARNGGPQDAEDAPAGTSPPLHASQELTQLRAQTAALEVQLSRLRAQASRKGLALDEQEGQGAAKIDSTFISDMPEEDWRHTFPQSDADLRVEATIQDRIQSQLKSLASDSQVQCRSGCCRLWMIADDTKKVFEVMNTSAGIDWFPAQSSTSSSMGKRADLTLCLGSNQPPNLDILPNRGIERDALIENALPALSICAKKAEESFELRMTLTIDEDGQVSDIDSTEKYAGQTSASCAVSALLTHAAFAPWIHPTTIILEFRLDPASGATSL